MQMFFLFLFLSFCAYSLLLSTGRNTKEKKKKIKDKKKNKEQAKKIQARGFEPLPLTRMAPKATALTTRPNLRRLLMQKQKKVLETRVELVTSCV
jgi:hypothetical protein